MRRILPGITVVAFVVLPGIACGDGAPHSGSVLFDLNAPGGDLETNAGEYSGGNDYPMSESDDHRLPLTNEGLPPTFFWGDNCDHIEMPPSV